MVLAATTTWREVHELGAAVKESTGVLLAPASSYCSPMPMVRILINSGVNAARLASIPITMLPHRQPTASAASATAGAERQRLAPSAGSAPWAT